MAKEYFTFVMMWIPRYFILLLNLIGMVEKVSSTDESSSDRRPNLHVYSFIIHNICIYEYVQKGNMTMQVLFHV